MTSVVNQVLASRTSTPTTGTAATPSRTPLSELPLSLFLAPLLEPTTTTSYNKNKRPSSPLIPRSFLSSSRSTSMSIPMSPAKRRILASEPTTIKRSIRADPEKKTPRFMGARVTDEDDGEGVEVIDEDEGQKEWESKSPARRLFFDDGERMSASPLPHPLRTTPLISQLTPEVHPSSPARLAPSPPISEHGTPPPHLASKNRSLGSPITPRPAKKARLPPPSHNTSFAITATAGPSTPPKPFTSHVTTPRSSTKKRLNLLSDLEDHLFSPYNGNRDVPASRSPSAGGSGGSRSRTRTVSVMDQTTNGTDDNADPNACGFAIWNDDEGSASGVGMDEDELDSGRALRGSTHLISTTGMIFGPPSDITTPTMSSASIPRDEEDSSSLVDQENRPPSRTWLERKVAIAVEVSVVETILLQTEAVEETEESASGERKMTVIEVDVDVEMK